MATKVITTVNFDKLIKAIRKKYPNVQKDLDPLIVQLKRGETPGNRLQRIASYEAYKVRVPNRDAQRGKSGGYRVIYYVRTAESVYMLEIYTKTEQEDVPDARILAAIEEVRAEAQEAQHDTSESETSSADNDPGS